jgi:flagellar protein FliO/FliZ
MDFLSFLRMMGSLAIVLGLLVGALWVVRRYELRLPQNLRAGFAGRGAARRMELIERLSLDPRRSITLIRLDDREYAMLIAPEGVLRLEAQPAVAVAEADQPATAAKPTIIASANAQKEGRRA